MFTHSLKRLAVLVTALLLIAAPAAMTTKAQEAAIQLKGAFSVAYSGYETLPLVVGLADATGYFGKDPIYLLPSTDQALATYTGSARSGNYDLTLPDEPKGRNFDVTTGQLSDAAKVHLYDVRLMSDVVDRGFMWENEDAIASSMRISVDSNVDGGTLIVWAADAAEQFPTARGADGVLFTADDPRTAIPAGYSLVNLDQEPFQIAPATSGTLNLITTGGGDVIDYTSLSCDKLIPALVDRTEKYYPFTELHQVNWDTIRADVINASQSITSEADCEALIVKIANAIPDGHMNFSLASVQPELAGTVSILLAPTSDGQIVVEYVRPGGPAEQAGIKAGAVITAWDGKPIQQYLDEMTLLFSNASTPHALLDIKLTQITRGQIGSEAAITFTNPGGSEQTVTIKRVQPVRASIPTEDLKIVDGKLPSGIGYIRLPSFAAYQNMKDFDAQLDALIKANVPGIIIDVRGNGGGFSQISDALASRFFDTAFTVGDVITTDGRYTYTARRSACAAVRRIGRRAGR
ncbi:MAG: S41 family peptidase [Anaerolineae bacterium]